MIKNLWAQLTALLQREPASAWYGLNAAVSPLLVYILHLSSTQTAAITTITTGLAAIITALAARPVSVPVIVGAAGTIVTACAAFGLKLPPGELATLSPALSAVLALLLRANLTPVVALRGSHTAQ